MNSLYQSQFEEDPLWPNYEALLRAVFHKDKKNPLRLKGMDYWQSIGRFERARKRGSTFRKKSDREAYAKYLSEI